MMAPAARDLAALAAASADRDLIADFLTTRSGMTAQLEYMTLSRLMDDDELLAMTNVRELLQDLPPTPFHTGAELSILERALGYESTGYGYRLRFDNDPQCVFGFEFVGCGNTVELVCMYTFDGRHSLHRTGENSVDPLVAVELIAHPYMLQRLLEGLEALGMPVSPRFYILPSDFVLENAAAASADIDEMF